MRKCAYCGKRPLPAGQRKYCNGDCATKFKIHGPAREQYVYKEIEPDVEMTKDGCWLVMRSSQTDEEVIGDFMRVFKRAPDHVIYDPQTPFWKFVGPVFDKEELNHRWRLG